MDEVSVTITGIGDMICSGDSGATTQVAFLLQHGPLSEMTADVATLASTTGTPSTAVLTKGQVRFVSSQVGLLLKRRLLEGVSKTLLRAAHAIQDWGVDHLCNYNAMCEAEQRPQTRMTYPCVSYGVRRDQTLLTPRTQTRNNQASSLNSGLSSQTGTKSAEECSTRGHCNRQTGHCMCYSKFRSSDGRGGEGDLGDCGYYDPSDPPVDCATAVPVWGSDSALCSGERAWREPWFREVESKLS